MCRPRCSRVADAPLLDQLFKIMEFCPGTALAFDRQQQTRRCTMTPHSDAAVLSPVLLLAGCGRAPADPGDPGWPPSQGKLEPPPGTSAKTPPDTKSITPGGRQRHRLHGLHIGDRDDERRAHQHSPVNTGGQVHTTCWRCTVPCYPCQVPLPLPAAPRAPGTATPRGCRARWRF